MLKLIISISIIICLSSFACSNESDENNSKPIVKEEKKLQKRSYPALGKGDHKAIIVNEIKHDKDAFTQGLIYMDGFLYESTGQYTRSKLRKIDPRTGGIVKSKRLGLSYFGEGLSEFQNKLYVLTWKRGICFVLDKNSFNEIQSFSYNGEGWGLTLLDNMFYMTNGSSELLKIQPENFKVRETIQVLEDGNNIDKLNELEAINGEIFANIWSENRIIRIDPNTGEVLGEIDLEFLLDKITYHNNLDVLNGIAYNPENNNLFVTGKNWDKIFEIKLERID